MPESLEKAGGDEETTYPLGAAARLTGLSPDVLRAWERRYGVVEPLRTEGGTRRYRASDLERLRLVKSAVDAGHRIGEVAKLDAEELGRRIAAAPERAPDSLQPVLAALERLDAEEAERLIALQLAALGPVRFARQFATPLLEEVGVRWAARRLCIASEHLASGLLRSVLGASLRPTSASSSAPRIVFGTPPGERHEMGVLIAAILTLGAGGNPLYLGADLPVEELLGAVETVGAAALALSVVAMPVVEADDSLQSLAERLPRRVELWVGGPLAGELELPSRAVRIDDVEALEHRVAMLELRVGHERA